MVRNAFIFKFMQVKQSVILKMEILRSFEMPVTLPVHIVFSLVSKSVLRQVQGLFQIEFST
jgi:hypothetical protein